jgi:hypothetical protein
VIGNDAVTASEWVGEGRYVLTATARFRASAEVLRSWLVEPELIRRWALGCSSLSVDERGLYVFAAFYRPGGDTRMYGRMMAAEPYLLVRRYRMSPDHDAPEAPFQRTVTYRPTPAMGGCELAVEILCEIPGLRKNAWYAAKRAEQRSLRLSLRRLAWRMDGSNPGLRAKVSQVLNLEMPQPL